MDTCGPSLAPPCGRSHTTLPEHPSPAQSSPLRLPIAEGEVSVWTGCVWRTLCPDSGVLTQCTCHISNENHRQPQAVSASNGGSFWARSKRVRWGGHCSLLSNVPAPAVYLHSLEPVPSTGGLGRERPSYTGKLRHRKDQHVFNRKPRAKSRLLNNPLQTPPRAGPLTYPW